MQVISLVNLIINISFGGSKERFDEKITNSGVYCKMKI
jgi:hypothetical protein